MRKYDGRNNGWLALSVREAAARARINKDTASRAFQTLAEKGFIEETQRGAFAWKARHASEYRLTWEKCDRTGRLPSFTYLKDTAKANLEPGPK